MKLLRSVPYVSLALVGSVMAIAILSDPELDFPFSEPPQGAALPAVELGLGSSTLFGRVLNDRGDPVDGAGVITKDGDRPVWTWTDAKGDFALRELAAGERSVLVNALGFHATPFDVAVDAIDSSTRAEPVTLTLERRSGAPPDTPGLRMHDVVGSVDLGAFARVDERYELLFMPTTTPLDVDGGFPRRALVEPDGSFDVPLLHKGPYRLVLLSPLDRGASSPDLFGDGEGGVQTYDHSANAEGTTLGLTSNAGAIRGVVIGPDSSPAGDRAAPRGVVRGALVRAERYAETPGRSPETEPGESPREPTNPVLRDEFRATRSDRNGRYVLNDLAPGRYRVTVVAGRTRRQIDVTVPPREAVDIDFETSR